jgi:transcriptional regulator with XRE-family HTH domain
MGVEPEVTEQVGARIRRLRLERGLSQRSLVGPGVSAAYLSRIEKGDRVPSVRALRVIAERLGVPAALLETGHPLPDPERRALELADAELELRVGADPDAAAERFRAILDEATDAGDGASAALARSGLGRAAAAQGDYGEAVRLLEPVVAAGAADPAVTPEAVATLARAYVAVGMGEYAVRLFDECVRELGTGGDELRAARLRQGTYLSSALGRADVTEERAALDRALRDAGSAAGSDERARMYWSQARAAEEKGEHALARAFLGRAIAVLEDADDALHLARAHLLYAESLIADARHDAAAERIAVAAAVLGARDPGGREGAWIAVLQAHVLVGDGRFDEAAGAARRVIAGAGDAELAGRGETVLGEALLRGGDGDGALAAFERADALLADAEPRVVLALLERWSEALESRGRLPDAVSVLRRAARLRATTPPNRL